MRRTTIFPKSCASSGFGLLPTFLNGGSDNSIKRGHDRQLRYVIKPILWGWSGTSWNNRLPVIWASCTVYCIERHLVISICVRRPLFRSSTAFAMSPASPKHPRSPTTPPSPTASPTHSILRRTASTLSAPSHSHKKMLRFTQVHRDSDTLLSTVGQNEDVYYHGRTVEEGLYTDRIATDRRRYHQSDPGTPNFQET